MDLKQLQVFVRVAEMGSFTKAAQWLQMPQPVVSRLVRQLEIGLHQHLLYRNGRGAVVTEAGQVLLEHARGILHQVERAQEAMQHIAGRGTGRVTLGLPPSLARVLTVPLTRAFKAALPQAQLAIIEGLSSALHRAVAHGELDLAVLYNPGPSNEVDLQPLFEEPLVLIQPAGDDVQDTSVVPLEALAQHALVIPSRPNAIRMQVESALATVGLKPRIAFEIDGVSTILDMVREGMGQAVLSRHALKSAAQAHALRMRAIEPPLYSQVALASSAHRPSTATQTLTRALLVEQCQRHLKS